MYVYSGDGDGTITFRRPSPNEHSLNNKGNLSCIEWERYGEDLGVIILDAKVLKDDTEVK
jgi:hypothetical protein